MGSEINYFRGRVKIYALAVATALIIFFFTDHLSTAVVVLGMIYIMVMIATKKTARMAGLAAVGITAAIAGVHTLAEHMDTSGNFRLRRLLVWVNPAKYSDSGGYQIIQGLYAVGSGGFWGKGLGNSSQKLGFILEAENDMILSVVVEELGVFGAILVLLMFGMLLHKLLQFAKEAVDLQGALIVMGIFAHISLQVILNFCVMLNLIPTTGITLPFISYGGTAVVFLMAEMGIALSVAAQTKKANEKELAELEAEEQ